MTRCKKASLPLFWGTFEDPFIYDLPELVDVTLHAVQLSFGTLGVVLNIILVLITFSHEGLSQRKSSYLTLSLAISDLLVSGGIIMTDSALFLAYSQASVLKRPSLLACQLWASFATFACCLSSLNIPAIALYRGSVAEWLACRIRHLQVAGLIPGHAMLKMP
ncbi:hypothetical protein ElyMa_006926800 [Elysia marginata]|uniref:G-protein coupled receptors family 1 profile domain-containing protein n=1 Tax=Elysia marginata TaxID=1093978 RepID=A0AAV4JFC5_9GAST|nr:hypothetical protein ElyMa_006926800 [Elysia marginata]